MNKLKFNLCLKDNTKKYPHISPGAAFKPAIRKVKGTETFFSLIKVIKFNIVLIWTQNVRIR